MDWIESLVERRIREATERGEFDDLPGAGRPLDLHDSDDPDWWIKRYLRTENVDLSLALPSAFALRREAEGFPVSLADLTREDDVRRVLEDFNARVEADWRRPVRGAGLPVQAYQVDVEDLVRQWREAATRSTAEDADGGSTGAERAGAERAGAERTGAERPGAVEVPVRGRRRRWWRRDGRR